MWSQSWSVPNGKNRNKLKISFINLSVFDGVLTCLKLHFLWRNFGFGYNWD